MTYFIRVLYFTASTIGIIFSYLFPRKLLNLIYLFFHFFYSGYIKMQFNKCGENFKLKFPFYVIGTKYINVGKNFNASYRLRMEVIDYHCLNLDIPNFQIGDNVSFNFDCHVACTNKVHIGNNVLFASKIFVTDHFHGSIINEDLNEPPGSRLLYSKGPVIIEDNVWVGEGACIMPNVTIGRNSIIGANAVVTKSIPPNSVAVGNPAKVIKFLS